MATREDEVIINVHDVEQEALIHVATANTSPMKITTHDAEHEALTDIESLIKRAQADEKNDIEKLLITEDIFKKIKESLIVTIKSMEKNPSLFSRAADFWGDLPLWQKIMGGLTVTVPTLILGLVANVGFLLALCGITTLAYAGGGIILDDHHNHTVSIIDSLTKGVLGLANLLEVTITALDKIRLKLADEVEKFSSENAILKNSNEKLSEELESLGHEIKAAAELTESLKNTKESLEAAAASLKEQMLEKAELLDLNQKKLVQVTEDYHASQQHLENKIGEFALIESKLGLELEKTRKTVLTLQDTVAQLVDTVIVGERQQQEFKERMDSFFETQGNKFNSIAERIGETEQKLAVSEVKLKQNNVEYQSQLIELRDQIKRLTELGDRRQKQIENVSSLPTDVLINALQKRGFFAIKNHQAETLNGAFEAQPNNPVVTY
ncbi:LegC2/C7 family Dot/Icm T4SS effector [Legionella rowbothamii]|uniref:LegC2/C7 family Dot/Icm T4SS effector n=1 Tax=Legionella rowbothamii TaxID=96229 RepID=UPI001055E573|nr:LegC2/C7 family Dot/Icm T4SS effector [Legionella rowbothamii]